MLERAFYCPIRHEIKPEKQQQVFEIHDALRGMKIEFEASSKAPFKIELATDHPEEILKQAVAPVYSVYQIPPPPSEQQLKSICPTLFF